ncbi:DUF924 family protein [Thalassotalea agarivorans]|uniref:Uncharacterized conserved protein, DUF924 family n=1 Tax=Thalassotalea agarivorans TaxID=349064 RepID=A0A1I0EWM5_THASX|nr:DUF924 family protein [Thalassotalea agarivorans]SET49551.1 Uncharacterized conserved protein, DUF924 family [Thalassotalea agarivorans]
MQYEKVIAFWFDTLKPNQWFAKSDTLDKEITATFSQTHAYVVAGESEQWRQHALGALAEIIVLDQFSRNIFRDRPAAFAYDGQALVLAQRAIELGLDQQLTPPQKSFMYMPFMHSESLAIHKIAETLFAQPGLEHNLAFELKHKVIIEQFGRYPHRNNILSRESTAEERAFLAQPGSSF